MTAWLDADWPAPPGVRALTTTRDCLGVSVAPFDSFNLGALCGDDIDAVIENRRQLETALPLPSSPRWLRQVHGIDVMRFQAPPAAKAPQGDFLRGAGGGWEGVALAGVSDESTPPQPSPAFAGEGEQQADAAVTAAPGTVLAILTADCLPVLFAAIDGSEVAAAHAGWRGLAAGVLEATVMAMRTPATELVAWLGPAAGPLAYEVDAVVRDAFLSHDPRAADAFSATRAGHWRVDLYALARQRLADAGMRAASIHGGGLCTIRDPARFYSHRRDQRTGRMATLVWIEG